MKTGDTDLRCMLSHVLWIGGATDAGKTTVAQVIAERYGFLVYNYDKHDLAHMKRLSPGFVDTAFDERWVHPEPEDLLQRALSAFQQRFPLVVEDLLALSGESMIVAEGFGLTPGLLQTIISSPRQAIWLVPTEEFKWASMVRRGKPSFKNKTSDLERATRNLLTRDLLLAEYVKTQVWSRGLELYEIDGSQSPEEVAAVVEHHFNPFLPER